MIYEFELVVNASHREVKAMFGDKALNGDNLRTLILRCDVMDYRYKVERKADNHFVLTSHSKVLLSLIEAWLGDRIEKIYRGDARQEVS